MHDSILMQSTEDTYLIHMVNNCNLSSPRIKILVLANLTKWCNHNLITSKIKKVQTCENRKENSISAIEPTQTREKERARRFQS